MELESVMIPATNRFASLYLEQKKPVKDFFHYDLKDPAVFNERYTHLMNRTFDRSELVQCIRNFMNDFPQSPQVKRSLEKLEDEQSVVVIGGQQAGLLTGPLYTIHKVISIITFAKQQEKQLGKPVVPLFWIAGEDHDYLEINHIFTEKNGSIQKKNYPEIPARKQMASDIYFSKSKMRKWAKDVFRNFGEQTYTKEMFSLVENAILQTSTYTEFFSYIIMSLFKDEGLLLIDSADESLRKIEKSYFSRLIDQHDEITKAVLDQQEEITNFGFSRALDVSSDAVNLFYYLDQDRELVTFDKENERFTCDGNRINFTKEQMNNLLEQFPERFSNNVVTRPLMQEYLFPTLAFIAGPGEIAYWGELKQAFELVDNKMPPIVPRLNITLLASRTEQDIADLQLSLQDVLEKGVEVDRDLFVQSIKDKHIARIIREIEAELREKYISITEEIKKVDRGLIQFAEKNLKFHVQQLNLLQRKVDESNIKKHEVKLEKYRQIEYLLRPNGQPQERIWNVFYFLNKYGENLIEQMLNLPYKFDGSHNIIKI